MSYKRAFVVEHSISRLLSEAHTLFLIGKTYKGVRFLMSRSIYIYIYPKAVMKTYFPETSKYAASK
jgi:hypothetical protein